MVHRNQKIGPDRGGTFGDRIVDGAVPPQA
jgi:hypothetical protein